MLALALLLAVCPPERRVEVTPQAWKAELARARPEGYQAALAELHLRPFPEGFSHVRLERVDLFPAHLVSESEQDWVVQARFSAEVQQQDETLPRAATLYRIQVLRPEQRGFCAAGDDLSADQPDEAPNAGPADGMHDSFGPITFRFVHLTSAAHQTIEVAQASQSISRISGRFTRQVYWDVVEGRLASVLALEQSDASSGFFEDYRHLRRWYALSGPPPRKVRLFEQRCEPFEPDAGPACAPVEERLLPFGGGRYGR